MVMPRGQELLQPANPLFIGLSLLWALALNLLPLGKMLWLPDMVLLTLAFWGVHTSQRIGMGTAFVLGLCMDVHQSALLGQHALAYTALMYACTLIFRRLSWLGLVAQAVQMLPLLAGAHALELLIRLAVGGDFPGPLILLSPVVEALLWPLASALLLLPQRRAPPHDEKRPL